MLGPAAGHSAIELRQLDKFRNTVIDFPMMIPLIMMRGLYCRIIVIYIYKDPAAVLILLLEPLTVLPPGHCM